MGMVLGALIGYTFIENRRIRLIYWGVGIPLLYLLAGGCAWLFIPLIWITAFSISLSTNAGDSLAGCDSGTVIGSSFAREDDLEILLGSMGSAIYPDVVCFESVWQIRYRVE